MKIAISTENDAGPNSKISKKFGVANYFVIYDTETTTLQAFPADNMIDDLIRTGAEKLFVKNIGENTKKIIQNTGVKVEETTASTLREIISDKRLLK